MARPPPEILISTEAEELVWDVLLVPNMWALTYDGQLISLRKTAQYLKGDLFRYPKTQFASAAIARNWAQRLNTIFKTDRFGYKEIN